MLKRFSLTLVALLLLVVGASLAVAAAITFTGTTAGQDAYIQNQLIPAANAALCAQFSLPASCTGAQLVSAGCVAQPSTAITRNNLVYLNCTPFTSDSAGESAYAADLFARQWVAHAANERAADFAVSCAAFKAATAANQNTACAAIGRPNGCVICQ